MWKKHKKELMVCVIVPIAIVFILLGMVTLFEKLDIHVAGTRDMWMGLIGAVIGGMFTLIGVLITIYRQEEAEEKNRRLENMPILGFELVDDISATDSTLSYCEGEMITSGFTFLEEKICTNFRIFVANDKSVFNFTIKGCLINGTEIPLGDAFNPAKRRLVSGDEVNLVFDCQEPNGNLFCVIRFQFEDIFGYKYYQDLPFSYDETSAWERDQGKIRQIIEIRDVKQQMLVPEEAKALEEAAKEYEDYAIFLGKEIRKASGVQIKSGGKSYN